jgi:methyl-accepting chemotaxis protein
LGRRRTIRENLIKGLNDLRDVAGAWREIATGAHRTSIRDLSDRIDQFLTFRTELVRLAREDGTAAARSFGDNDANRSVRTALNEKLQVLERSYEQDVKVARERIEVSDRDVLNGLLWLALFSLATLAGGIAFIKWLLVHPAARAHIHFRRAGDRVQMLACRS